MSTSVRATYTTVKQGLHPDFLASFDPPTDPKVPIFHITPDNFIPSLLPGEVSRIDTVFEQSYSSKRPSAEVKAQVMGKKGSVKPEIHALGEAMVKVHHTCAHCHQTAGENMPVCGG